jgi:hypothetical protein
VEEGEEVAGGFVIASGDTSALLESREQAFDVVAFSIELLVVRPLNLSIAPGRNDRLASLSVDHPQHFVTVIAFVGDDLFRRESFQQRRGLSDVVCLTRRQQKLDGIAESVAGRVNLRAESAARSAELLTSAFLRAPAA